MVRYVLIGIPPDYNNDVERKKITHPLLLLKAEAEGVISKQDIEVLKRAIGSTDNQEHEKDVKSESILPPVQTVAKRRSVLDDKKYAPVIGHTGPSTGPNSQI